MKKFNLQAVMIDLDGTMVDTIGDFEVALNRALTDLNIPTAHRGLIERGIGKGSEHLIRTVLLHQLALPEVASHQHEVEQLFSPVWKRYEHHYLSINGEFSKVFPGGIPLSMVEDVALVGPIEKIRDDMAKWRESCITTFLVSGPAQVLSKYADIIHG